MPIKIFAPSLNPVFLSIHSHKELQPYTGIEYNNGAKKKTWGQTHGEKGGALPSARAFGG